LEFGPPKNFELATRLSHCIAAGPALSRCGCIGPRAMCLDSSSFLPTLIALKFGWSGL